MPPARHRQSRPRHRLAFSLATPTSTVAYVSTLVLLLVFLAARPAAAQEFKNDFSLYPKAAQPCLDGAASSSGCNGATNKDMNKCLCGGTAFALAAASCIGRQSPGDLQAVYTIMSTSCSDSKVDLAVSKNAFLAAASAAATSSPPQTAAAAATTAPPKPITTTIATVINNLPTTLATVISIPAATTDPAGGGGGDSGNTNNGNDGAMSSTAKTGIIAGAAVAGAAIAAVLVVFILRHRRKRAAAEEAHPMLPVGSVGAAAGTGGSSFKDQLSPHSQYAATPVSGHNWAAAESKWGSQPSHTQPYISPSPSPLSAYDQPQQPPGWGYDPTTGAYVHQQQPGTAQTPVFEAPGPEPPQPVEMPAASAAAPDWVRQQQQQQHYMHSPR